MLLKPTSAIKFSQNPISILIFMGLLLQTSSENDIFGAIAHFERRLIAECTKEGINTTKLKGKLPSRPTLDKEKLGSALKLIESGLSPTAAAKQLSIGRSTII